MDYRSTSFAKILIVFVSATVVGCLPQNESGSVTDSGNTGAGTGRPPDFTVTPDPIDTPTPTEVPSPGDSQISSVVIDGGALWTSAPSISVSLNYSEAKQYRLSLGPDCHNGDWTDMQSNVSVAIPAHDRNRLVQVAVQFLDYDNYPTVCLNASILHDDRGPEILFTKYPLASVDEGVATQLAYEVKDLASEVVSMTCSLNSIVRPCAPGLGTADIPGLIPGDYTFTISAVDSRGFQSEASVSWTVTSLTRTLKHNIEISEYRKWDILFIVDNSGSMAYEQKNMAERTKNFLSVLRGLDWQIAVTTTDPRNVNLGDGRFIPVTASGDFILTSAVDEVEAQARLSATLQRPETGSGSEQGIRSTYRVVERSRDGVHKEFFRDGAHFAVVLISDEDESANTDKNDPELLLKKIGDTFDNQKNFLFNSIITVPGDTKCRSTDGYSYGERYKMISDLTGGVIGSVCESDYAAQISGIAQKIRNMAQSLTLSCLPIAGEPIVITRNGVAVTDAFTVNGVTISFANAIQPGNYELTYKCLR